MMAEDAATQGADTAEDFDSFVARTQSGLRARAWMFYHHWQDAEDAVQNAYLTAFKHWDRVSEQYESPEAWLYTVLRNELLGQRRRRTRERSVVEKMPVPYDPTPEQTAEAMAVLEALAGLSAKQRAAIVLHRLYGLPQEEVAALLGVERSTVAGHVHIGRRALARALGLRPAAGERPRDALVTYGRLPHGGTAAHGDPLDEILRATERWLRESFEDSPEEARRICAAIRSGLNAQAAQQAGEGPARRGRLGLKRIGRRGTGR